MPKFGRAQVELFIGLQLFSTSLKQAIQALCIAQSMLIDGVAAKTVRREI
jgi:hypothetical protein